MYALPGQTSRTQFRQAPHPIVAIAVLVVAVAVVGGVAWMWNNGVLTSPIARESAVAPVRSVAQKATESHDDTILHVQHMEKSLGVVVAQCRLAQQRIRQVIPALETVGLTVNKGRLEAADAACAVAIREVANAVEEVDALRQSLRRE